MSKQLTLKHGLVSAAVILALGFSTVAGARMSQADADRLGTELTPVGAEKAANKEGTIPAWTGGQTQAPAGYKKGGPLADPFAAEKPSVTITKQNAAQYKDKLPAGAVAMLNKHETFKMNVYPTHRTAALPKAVTDKVKEQATKVETQGFGLSNVGGSTTPFPKPTTGVEVMWNHLTRYLGGGFERQYASFPVRSNGSSFEIKVFERRVFAQNMDQNEPNRLLYFLSSVLSPATLSGNVYLVHEPLDQVKESRLAWIYNAGQRRVRRAPDLGYDAITDGTEGMRFVDQYDAFSGAPDRFDFKLVGKKEMYVPYNAYKLSSSATKYDQLIKPGSVNSDYMRYELHRVWVVDATLKPGQKHSFSRRTFYVDEDSWTVLWEDAYDSRGELWRVGIHPVRQHYDAGVMEYAANMWHDLSNGGYLAGTLMNQEPPWSYGTKGKLADFQPDALRRVGTR